MFIVAYATDIFFAPLGAKHITLLKELEGRCGLRFYKHFPPTEGGWAELGHTVRLNFRKPRMASIDNQKSRTLRYHSLVLTRLITAKKKLCFSGLL